MRLTTYMAERERRLFAGGRISPQRITEGTISCDCGYEGQPLEVERWDLLPSNWLGLCPCGSSRAVTPAGDDR